MNAMSAVAATADQVPVSDKPIRVMVVDDAIVVRSLFMRWIDGEPDMKVVAALRTGREAIEQIERYDPDIVLLDVDMPELDGISALPILLAKKRGLPIIMVSTLTRRSAELSMRALALGATDYIPKPQTNYAAMTSSDFHRALIDKIRGIGGGSARARATPCRRPPSPNCRGGASFRRRCGCRRRCRRRHRQPHSRCGRFPR